MSPASGHDASASATGGDDGIPGHLVEKVLRRVDGRRVIRTMWRGRGCATRVLTRDVVAAHFAPSIHAAVLRGSASYASLGNDIAMTLDGYAVAARLLGDPGDPPLWTRVLDAGITTHGHVYVTTEWVDGIALHQLERELSAGERLAMVQSLAEIFVRLHGQRVAYGDLKLANLVLRVDGGLTLIDLDTMREVPAANAGVCTLYRTENWAAPEQIDRQELWLGSDLWAFARVVRELWGQHPPSAWLGALAACRHADPLRRPTIQSLAAHLVDPSTALVDHAGDRVDLRAAAALEAPSRTNPGSFETDRVGERNERVGDKTDRVPNADGTLPGARAPRDVPTERVPDPPRAAFAGAPARGQDQPSAPTILGQAQPPRRPAAVAQSGGCLGFVLGLGQFALYGAVGTAGALFAAWFAWTLVEQNAADAMADEVLAQLKVHKTDPARNGKSERDRLATAALAAWDEAHTRRSCAVRAVTLVWQQRWHFDDDWSPTDFAKASDAVSEPLCAREPEAILARATLYAGACRRRNGDVPAVEDCAAAIAAMPDFWTTVPATAEFNWLKVEGAWQEVRARSAIASRNEQLGNAEAAAQEEAALARCDAALAWLPYAPVNGPELLEECLVVAGLAGDAKRYLGYADLRLKSPPATTELRQRLVRQLYQWAGPECADSEVKWRRSTWTVSAPAWCHALGSAARSCVADSNAAFAQRDPADNAHDWEGLAALLSTRSGACYEKL